MKKVLAVIVSIFWLALIVGIPALVLTGNATQFIPAQIQEQLAQFGMQDILDRLGAGAAVPTPDVDEPVVEAATPAPTTEPTAVPTEPPPPEPTATPEPQPTATPLPEPTLAPPTATPAEPALALPVAVRSQAELRTGPGPAFDAVGLVDAGATILVSAQDVTGEWFQLDNGNWIPSEALASKPPVPIVLPTEEVTPEEPAPETPASPEPVTPDVPATPVVVRVNADANLRSGPGGTFDRVGGVNFGNDVTVVGKFATDNWYLLDSGAWIFGELLESAPDVPQVNADGTPVGTAPAATDPTTAPAPDTDTGTPTVNILANLRAAPNTNAAITGTAQPGEALTLVGTNEAGDWLKLESGSWIFAELVDNAPTDLPVAAEDTPAVGADTQDVTDTTPITTTAVTTTAVTTTAVTTGTTTAGAATASVSVDANLRGGPDTSFDLVGSISAGTTLTLVGRNEAGDWLKLDNGPWIFGELVIDAPADLPVVTE